MGDTYEIYEVRIRQGLFDVARGLAHKVAPEPGAIDRMDEVITWPGLIRGRNWKRNQQVLTCCALRMRTSTICRLHGVKHRNTVYSIRNKGLETIVDELEKKSKIKHDKVFTFREKHAKLEIQMISYAP